MNADSRPLCLVTLAHTPVGPLTLAATELGLARISVGFPFSPAARLANAPDWFQDAITQFEEYFAQRRQVFDLPIDWGNMTGFARRARSACMEIPYGQTRTYARLAAQLDNPNGSRAVGSAMAANPLPILIPCHRVIGTDGKLHGYAAPDGIQTKIRLLQLEGVSLPVFAQPSLFL